MNYDGLNFRLARVAVFLITGEGGSIFNRFHKKYCEKDKFILSTGCNNYYSK